MAVLRAGARTGVSVAEVCSIGWWGGVGGCGTCFFGVGWRFLGVDWAVGFFLCGGEVTVGVGIGTGFDAGGVSRRGGCCCGFVLLFSAAVSLAARACRLVGRFSGCLSINVSSALTCFNPSERVHWVFPVKLNPLKALTNIDGKSNVAAMLVRK